MMGPRICERESEIVRLARQPGEPPADLAAHLARCPDCREAFDVARYMIRMAADTDAIAATRPLPEPAQLWWKARLLQRWNAQSRATAPLDWMQRIEVVGGIAAVIVLMLMFWADVRPGVHTSTVASQFWPTVAGLLAPGALSSAIVGALLLIGCLSLFTLRQLMVED
jgi:predicted anti-sigma-YlaC factor YlaD